MIKIAVIEDEKEIREHLLLLIREQMEGIKAEGFPSAMDFVKKE